MSTEPPKFIRLANGDLIDTKTGKRAVNTEINKAYSDAPKSSVLAPRKRSNDFQGARRYLDDLPLPPDQSRAVAIIAAYRTFGLADADICYVLSIDGETLEKVSESEAYQKFLDIMLANIREHDKDKVRKKINDKAEEAADALAGLVESRDEKVRLKASAEILNRATNTSVGAQTGRDGNNSSLTIRIIDDTDNPHTKVMVDIDA